MERGQVAAGLRKEGLMKSRAVHGSDGINRTVNRLITRQEQFISRRIRIVVSLPHVS
jgi:hypothetical protein